MVLAVPASYGLLPGLAIFRGLYEMVNGSSPEAGTLSLQGGLTTLLGAMAVLLAIAAGSVLGEFLAAPFDHRMVQKRAGLAAAEAAGAVACSDRFSVAGCGASHPGLPWWTARFALTSPHGIPDNHAAHRAEPRHVGVSPEGLRADEDGGTTLAATAASG
jgi:hypothetical protein